MNSARLELFQDDATTAPRLSRVMPAALYNIVPEASFIEYCNTIDSLLALAAADYMCRSKRLRWCYLFVVIWYCWIMGAIFTKMLTTPGSRFYDIYNVSILVLIFHMCILWIWMKSSTGGKSSPELTREIRFECQMMTNRIAHVSFHVVLLPLVTAHRAQNFVVANPIDHIVASISAVGIEVGKMSNIDTMQKKTQNTSQGNADNIPFPDATSQQLRVVSDTVPYIPSGNMSTVRLEILADEFNDSPRLSRSFPAALNGLVDVNDVPFQEFCDRLDTLVTLLDKDNERRWKRIVWMRYGFFAFIVSSLALSVDVAIYIHILMWVYLAIVWIFFTYYVRGQKSSGEITYDIQSVCKEMTIRTPHLCFHPAFQSIPLVYQNMDLIDHIDVSITSDTFIDETSCVTHSKIATGNFLLNSATTTVNDGYQQLERV